MQAVVSLYTYYDLKAHFALGCDVSKSKSNHVKKTGEKKEVDVSPTGRKKEAAYRRQGDSVPNGGSNNKEEQD